MWEQIEKLSNIHGYMSGVDRMTDRVKDTGEIFTPTFLVIEMMQKMLEENAAVFEPGKTILDPACGDGQLLVPIKWFKVLNYGITEAEALTDIYGVDIMRDNVDLCKKRLGGGTIIMGSTVEPYLELEEQTEIEHNKMIELFGSSSIMEFFS
jgi:2-polyprenyl-3-methyl-5-hydroxy-6-metoxy-1,4-benzoquinol methylase